MTNEDRAEAIQRGEDRAENLERLYYDNMGLWVSAVRPFLAVGDREELMQQAFLSVADAAASYDRERGAFSTYAVMKVKQDIPVYLASCGNGLSYSHYWASIRAKYRELLAQGITDEQEQAARLGVSVSDIWRLSRRVVSLDEIRENVGDNIPSGEEMESDALDRIGAEELRSIWEEVERLLGNKRFEVIKALFVRCESVASVADRMGCTTQYISQMKIDALKRLGRSKRLREIALDFDYITAMMWRGGYKTWKFTDCSVVERCTMEREKAEREKQVFLKKLSEERAELLSRMREMQKGV